MNPDRKTYIGGPDAAMIVGRSPFGGPFDVWQRKMGIVDEMADLPIVVRCGAALEDLVLELYGEQTGYAIEKIETVIDPVDTWRGGSVDGIATGQFGGRAGIVEAKTADGWKRVEYGEEKTDEIPDHHIIQCAWYMPLLDLPFCDVPILFGRHQFCIFRVLRNPKLEAALIDRCRRFWFDHVVAKVPPPVDGTDAADDYLERIFPRNELDMIAGDASAEIIMRELSEQNAGLELAERKKKLFEQQLKQIIGDNDGIQCGSGRATWKAGTDGKRRFRYTDY